MAVHRTIWLITLAALVSAACSSSDPAEPDELRWLAVGDSYSSGEGLPDVEGACANSPSAYAPLLASTTATGPQVEQFVFSACTGAVTDDWPAQLQAWGADQPDQPNLITATFGGNDIGFAEVFMDCIGFDDGVNSLDDVLGLDFDSVAALLLGRGCDIGEDEINGRIDALDPVLVDLYAMMADVVGDEGNVFILGYPAPLAEPESWPFPVCEGVSRGDGETLLRAADRLNDVIADATDSQPNVHFVDVAPAFVGHGRCSDEEWIYGLIDILDIDIPDADDTSGAGVSLIEEARPFHPNQAGHLAMATALDAALQSVFPSRE